MTTVNATATYAIDAAGVLVAVDDGFRELARAHGHPELAEAVVGRPRTELVAGPRPRALQRSLIERAHHADARRAALSLRRARGAALRPTADRAASRRGTAFTTWFEAVEERERQPLLDYDLPRGDETVWLCAWCNRFDVGGWREVEDAGPRLAFRRCRGSSTVSATSASCRSRSGSTSRRTSYSPCGRTEIVRPLRPVLKSTTPARSAKIVWSRPRPVPSPG